MYELKAIMYANSIHTDNKLSKASMYKFALLALELLIACKDVEYSISNYDLTKQVQVQQ